MMNLHHAQIWIKRLILMAVAVVHLTGCGLEDLLDDLLEDKDVTASDVQISGSVGDGPVTGATVMVYSAAGDVLGTFTSDSGASFRGLVKVKGNQYPLRLTANGGTDLVTGSVPDFEMISVVAHPSDKNANINPFSTLIVGVAESMPGGLNRGNVDAARGYVMDEMSFGLSGAAVPDPITTVVTDSNVAEIVKASETLGEMVRRTRDRMTAAGSPLDGDSVLAALAADMVDGALDGQGASGTNPLVTATANVVSGQVLLEAASNNLKVGGAVATQTLDLSIISTHANVTGSQLTGNVRITQGLLDQLELSLAAIQVLDQGQAVTDIATTVSGLPADALPGVIAGSLPVSQSASLDNALALVKVATPAEIDAVNQAAAGGSGNPEPGNTVPLINGTPASQITAGNAYTFQPSASDADGDALSFSISNKPSWAGFNTATGRLSGTPGDQHAGTYANIVISVSDGTDTASLPGFSIQVAPAPVVNTPPVIGGSPTGSVFSNTGYTFQPTASDADGDALSFSISNKPSWAGFNTSTGGLSGMPGDQHAGTYTNIVISVSDGTDTASLPGFSIQVEPAPVVNTPPVIGGSPAGNVTANSSYSFQPSASDADGDTLTFSISNKPSWASFNSGTGRLDGTPSDTHAGTYGNIVISVTDGTDTVSLAGFSVQVDPSLGSFSLGWVAPTTRADGTPLSLAEIGGYRVYYGASAGNYPDSVDITNGSATSVVINNVPNGTYHVVMSTIDSAGLEGAKSAAITKVAQ